MRVRRRAARDPTYGGICSPRGGVPCSSDVCKTFDLGPIASGGGELSCASCDCTSDSGSFSGDVCGYSTDELMRPGQAGGVLGGRLRVAACREVLHSTKPTRIEDHG